MIMATLYFSRKFTSLLWATIAGLALGGVSGNLLDRLFRAPAPFRGEVVDWIELPHWPTFNLADSALFIAACIAVVATLKNIPPTTRKDGVDKEDRVLPDYE
jgi:signal peptidase II